MILAAGRRVGPYEIAEPIGAGGMGQVFRARDLRLGRDVALKVLSEKSGADAHRMALFERETRVLASLNHPNIATLHGIEQVDHTHALVPDVDGGRWQVSSGGGIQPAWSRDAHTLFYLAGSRLLRVEVSGQATPVISMPRVALASIGYTPFDRSGRTYDVAPDGRRFLISEPATGGGRAALGAAKYDVVLNWTPGLQDMR